MTEYCSYYNFLKWYFIVEAKTIAPSDMMLTACRGDTEEKYIKRLRSIKKPRWK